MPEEVSKYFNDFAITEGKLRNDLDLLKSVEVS